MRYIVYIASYILEENNRGCNCISYIEIKVSAKMCTCTLGLQELFLPTLTAALLLTFRAWSVHKWRP